jgi:CreA protein
MSNMKLKASAAFLAVAVVGGGIWMFSGDDEMPAASTNETQLGEVDTTWRVTKNDSVIVTRYDDPKIEGITIYVSRAKKGGMSGALGFATDPSNASIAVRQTGPIKVRQDFDGNEKVLSESTSVLFKALHITRMYDAENESFVYLVTSDKLVDGSPKNSISVVVPRDMDGQKPDLSLLKSANDQSSVQIDADPNLQPKPALFL